MRLTKGYERQIYDAEATYKPNYVPFDFAHFCSKDRYDSMKIMIDKTDDDLRKNGFFVEDLNTRTVLQMQGGCVRTNCLDSLDRTNVAQSKIGLYML